ncbi:P-loop containing nucleoside triphosphate hydrolase protein [Trichoderma barbatum]
MSAGRSVSSNSFGPNTEIRQGDTIINNYSSNASRKAYHVLPFPHNEDIIRRPEIVAQLDELLSPSKEGRYCSAALWGLSGSGKTQIALDYIYRRNHEDPACDIFWAHVDNETSFARDYQKIARKLSPDSKLNGEELFLEVRDRIESLQQWLLILDNADDLTRFGVGVASDQTQSLLKYIPQGPGGTVLWTSCDEQIVGLVGPSRGVQITHMNIKEAEQLLAKTRNQSIRDDEIQDVRLLLKELQWLPLAISQAGTFLRRTPTPIKKYVSRLKEGKSRWDVLKKSQYERHRRLGISNSILETLNISIQHIRQESEMIYQVLQTIAYVDNQNIPLAVILAAATAFAQPDQDKSSDNEEQVLETVVPRLKEYSFIRARNAENNDEPSFDMHKLVQEAIRYRLNTEDITMEAYFSGTALSVIANLFPEKIEPETWPQCQQYATHAIQVSDWAELSGDVAKTTEFLDRATNYFRDSGFLRKAEYTAKKQLILAKKAFGEAHPNVFIPIGWLMSIYILPNEQWEGAEKLALEAIALSEKNISARHDVAVAAYQYLAGACLRQGQIKEAEEFQVKQLSLRQEFKGERHPYTLRAMLQLAQTYDRQNQYEKSKELNAKILALYSEVLREGDVAIFDFMNILAEMYLFSNQSGEANESEAEFLALVEEIDWEKHPEICDLEALAVLYHRHGQYGKFKNIRKRIRGLWQKKFGEKHFQTIVAMHLVALAHGWDKEFTEAKELQSKCQTLLDDAYGENNEWTAWATEVEAQLSCMQRLSEKGGLVELVTLREARKRFGDKIPSSLLGTLEHLDAVGSRAFFEDYKKYLEDGSDEKNLWNSGYTY